MTLAAARSVGPDLFTLRPYGRHGWATWAAGLLRSTGFAADGLDALALPELVAAADAVRSGALSTDAFAEQFDHAETVLSGRVSEIAADPHFGEAITWQNTPFLPMVAKLQLPVQHPTSRRRATERRVAQYWQRYCAKADTIGSFGPFAWLHVTGEPGYLNYRHGDGLIGRTRLNFEAWMVVALGEWLTSRPELRWWLPPVLSPMVDLDEHNSRLIMPGQPALRLRPLEVAVLRLADGTRTADAIARLVEQGRPGTTAAEVQRVLVGFARRRQLAWDANIPISVHAWRIFTERIAAVGDPALRAELDALVDRFEQALASIAAAAEADSLRAALESLEALFVEVTGVAAHRADGAMYAGRSLCYFDALRALDGTLGTDFLDSIDDALALLLRSADWYADRLARGYAAALDALVRRHRDAHPHQPTRLSDVWASSLALFWGPEPAPLLDATDELSRRWAGVLGRFGDAGSRVQVTAAEIAADVAAAFEAVTPLPELSVHSPDLQLVSAGPDALAAGDFTVVLGELHACYASFDVPVFDWSLPRGSAREAVNQVLGLQRLVPLFPDGWRRNTGRVVAASAGSSDQLLGFARAATPDRTRVWSMASITIVEGADGLELECPDGRRLPLLSAWLVPIGMVAADGFKVGLGGPHTPRLSIDRLVVFRETWRLDTRDVALPPRPSRHADFVAVRDWQLRHQLPDEVFVKFATEVKPTYLAFASPQLVAAFAAAVRAQRRADDEPRVVVSEALPRPADSWLTDTRGRRYVSEVRLQLTRARTPQEEL